MINTLGNVAHKAAVVGLVGLTISGGGTIASGLYELRQRRMQAASPAASAPPAAAAPSATTAKQ